MAPVPPDPPSSLVSYSALAQLSPVLLSDSLKPAQSGFPNETGRPGDPAAPRGSQELRKGLLNQWKVETEDPGT